jgi:hypothetical protein
MIFDQPFLPPPTTTTTTIITTYSNVKVVTSYKTLKHLGEILLALPTTKAKKKDIVVFRFIIEYSSSLRDFYRPLGNNNRSIFMYLMIFER